MYVSCLLIDVGDNPDRPRPGRSWLRNVYHVHQRLCMAFPSQLQRTSDPHFLAPYHPTRFAEPPPSEGSIDSGMNVSPRPCSVLGYQRPVHVRRDKDHNFLFRIDPQPGNRVVILVQSAIKPDWDYAFQNASYLLAAPPSDPKPIDLIIESGTRLRFRLLANPVRKVSQNSVDAAGKPFGEKWLGKHVPVPATQEYLRNWLERRSESGWSAPKNSEHDQFPPGFRIEQLLNIQTGQVFVNKGRDSVKGQRFPSARFDGILAVTDPVLFRQTLARGIGPAKAFGFGLLSIAPVEASP